MNTQLRRLFDAMRATSRSTRLIVAIIVGATVLKLVLAANQGVTALAGEVYDDALFVRGATFIKQGLWLGPYNNLTLMKGPFFPLWIAAASLLSMPLPVANQLLYVCASGLAAWVTRPFLQSRWASTALYCALLFNPITMADGPATRVLRENVYPALTLLVIACAIGLWTRASSPPGNWLPWAAALGTAGAAFWLTREEGVWIFPLLLLASVSLAPALTSRKKRWRLTASALAPWLAAVVVGMAFVGSVAAINARVYGVRLITEGSSGGFPRAYGALARISPDRWLPDAPVPADVRRKAYAVSPTLASIAPGLEFTCAPGGPPQTNASGEIRGGWFQWSFRDAAAIYGVHSSAVVADRFYNQVANEINAACSDGRLPSGPPRTGLAPPLRIEYLGPFASASWWATGALITFDGMDFEPSPSSTSTNGLTWSTMAASVNAPFAGVDPTPPLFSVSQRILSLLSLPYRWITPLATLLALAATILAVVLAIRDRRDRRALSTATLLVTLATLVLARIGLVSLLHVTSFEAVGLIYLAPAYGILILWAFLGATGPYRSAAKWLKARRAERSGQP